MSISHRQVHNKGDPNSKLWLVGEAPGEDEDRLGEPFVGRSGDILMEVLNKHGVDRKDVYLANVCQFRPYNNIFNNCLNTPELALSLTELYNSIDTHRPNCIVPLGNWPLHFLADKFKILSWRGSIIPIRSDIKAIPTVHPAYVARNIQYYPIFAHDIKRAISDSKYPELNYPDYKININPSDIEYLMQCDYLTVDIECTRKEKKIICVGFGNGWTGSVFEYNKSNQLAIHWLLQSNIPKVFHHGIFDVPILESNGHIVNNYAHDTIVQAHILEPELPRSLGYLASIYTRIPYYKTEGREALPSDIKAWSSKRTTQEVLIYNGKDTIVTAQCHEQQMIELNEQRDLYEYEMESLRCSIQYSRNGMYRDPVRTQAIRDAVVDTAKSEYRNFCMLIGEKVNPRSPKQIHKLLYKILELPEKKDRKGKVIADEDALVSLMGHCANKLDEYKSDKLRLEWARKLVIMKLMLSIRGHLKTLSSYIDIKASSDGLIRSLYKVFGTETGRASATKYVDDTGLNAQTFPRGSVDVPDAAQVESTS